MIAGPLLPNPTTETAHGMQYGVAGLCAWSVVLPRPAVFARRNNGLRAALRHGVVAGLGIVGAIAAGVVRHLNGADFQGAGINAKVHFATLMAVVGAMFLPFSITFTEHFDASTVDQQAPSGRRRVRRNRHGELLLPTADGTDLGNLLIKVG